MEVGSCVVPIHFKLSSANVIFVLSAHLLTVGNF